MGNLTLRVITPDRIVIDTAVDYVQLPGVDGSIGVLPRHAHLVTALAIGLMSYKDGGKEETLFLSGGFAEVRNNTIRVVSEAGERPDEIDEDRAKRAEGRARQRLDGEAKPHEPQLDIVRARTALHRARQRLIVSRGYARTLV